MKKKLFVWVTEYDVLLSLAKNKEDAKLNILDELECEEFDYDREEIENTLTEDPIVLETGAMILTHSDE